jgi:hypothetical protein
VLQTDFSNWQGSRQSGSLSYFKSQYHTNGSQEWYSIYGHWICIDLLYKFCGSESIKFYLKEKNDADHDIW